MLHLITFFKSFENLYLEKTASHFIRLTLILQIKQISPGNECVTKIQTIKQWANTCNMQWPHSEDVPFDPFMKSSILFWFIFVCGVFDVADIEGRHKRWDFLNLVPEISHCREVRGQEKCNNVTFPNTFFGPVPRSRELVEICAPEIHSLHIISSFYKHLWIGDISDTKKKVNKKSLFFPWETPYTLLSVLGRNNTCQIRRGNEFCSKKATRYHCN